MRFATRAIHAGQEPDPTTGATVLPIHPSTTFTQEGIGKHKGFEYARSGNPTRAALEKCIASLEAGRYGLAFASGQAAAAAVLSLLKPGDHIVAGEDLYGGTYRLFEKVYAPLGIPITYVNGRDATNYRRALRPQTRLLWAESPTNPLLHLTDIAAVAGIAREHKALLAVDNTFATPCLQSPLQLGAHLAVHSTTKYIAGHSDVVGGAVVTDDEELYRAIRFYQNAAGAVPSPFDAWLTLRGIKTLVLRMERHCSNAIAVARGLLDQPAVEAVFYPGLESHPQNALARKQMRDFGGVVAFTLRGGQPAADRFVRSLRIFSYAESLGGVESLACYPATMTHGSLPESERLRRGITPGLVRLSVGIEDAADLIADLQQALGSV